MYVSSTSEDDKEVITILESYDIFDMPFSKKFISHFSFLTDSTDYLKNISGFSSMRSGGTNADIMFRGMFGSRLRILGGCGEIFGACASRMDSSSAYLFSENFDIVSLIKGPQTVLWGPVCSGGVVRFERDTPSFYTPDMKIRSSTTIGSYNRVDKDVNIIFGNSSGYLRLIGSVSHSNDYLDAKKHIIPSSWNRWNTNVIFGFTPIADFLFEGTLSQSNGNARYAGRGVDATCFARESFEMRLKKNYIQDNLYGIDITSWYHYVNHVMNENSNAGSNMYQSSIIGNNLFYNDRDKNCVDRITSGARGVFVYRWCNMQISYGADMQINQHHRKSMNGDWFKDSYFQDFGLFVELDWLSSSFSKFVSGVRLERTLVKYYSIEEKVKRRSIIYPAGFIRYERVFCPDDVLLLTTYIGIGLNKRFPDYWELIVLKSGKKIGQDAFYRLKEEKNVQLDIGARCKSEKIDTWISSYFGYMKDFILYRYYDNNTIPSYGNVHDASCTENVDAVIRGSEIGCDYRLNSNLHVESNISYIFGKNVTNDSPLPQIPPLEAKMILIWEYGVWTSRCIWRVVSAQSRISVNDGNVITHDISTSKGFSTFSIGILRQISHKVKWGFGVNNLFNKNYSEHLNMSGNKRFECLSGSSLYEPGRIYWMSVGVMF